MNIIKKIRRRLWQIIVQKSKNKSFYTKLYKSYWHQRIHQDDNSSQYQTNYFTAVPNPGAGIGHQIANWNAGYWYAKKFGLRFAHTPFSTSEWDEFLGFGENEVLFDELVNNLGYRKVLLPFFLENNEDELNLIKKIIKSYQGKKVVFLTEQDQSYCEQFGVATDIQKKFFRAKARKFDHVIFNKENFNIAIHVRRGDIVSKIDSQNSNLSVRWQDTDYFKKVLKSVVRNVKTQKPISIYLFSQGELRDFHDFKTFSGLQICLEMNAKDSFLHMVKADLLISSKSSFSYKPALLNSGIKVCPKNFWHGYPNTEDWILVDDNGDTGEIKIQISN